MQIREVSVRYRKSDIPLEKGQSFKSSVEVFRAFHHQVLEPVEVFHVLHLNAKNRMLCLENVARGTLTACLVHPSASILGKNAPYPHPGVLLGGTVRCLDFCKYLINKALG